MTTLPIDTVPCWCPTWADIKDKAHFYKTARVRETGQYVAIKHVTTLLNPGTFFVELNGVVMPFDTDQLCDFCL